MNAVLLVIHMMVAAALVGTILLQRSEGGALGIGGGGGSMSGRSAGNALTKTTAALAAMFLQPASRSPFWPAIRACQVRADACR
jgi:preprotein translocase subunit SecG